MKKVINISSNGIKQAIDDLVNENEILQDKVYKLEEQLQQKENIIKEVREYINKWKFETAGNGVCMGYEDIQDILKILDKEEVD